VTVDVGTVPGPGNLLGNLLNNLSHILDCSASTTAINNALGRVVGLIDQILAWGRSRAARRKCRAARVLTRYFPI
jgi:hypothetical protein